MICPSMSYKYYDIVSVGIVKSDFILMTLLNITPVLAATAAHMYRAHKKSVVATRNLYIAGYTAAVVSSKGATLPASPNETSNTSLLMWPSRGH